MFGSKMDLEQEEDTGNLIVNYLPADMDDQGFKAMFETIGKVKASKLMRNPAGESLAFGFIHYEDPSHGLLAIKLYDGQQRGNKTMKVAIATKKSGQQQTKNLYVADIPTHISEDQLASMFGEYGHVSNCKLVMDPITHKSKGFAFVLFVKASDAEAAINGLNGFQFPGCEKPMLVKVKDEHKSSNPHLYVNNVPKHMDEEGLKKFFSAYGEVRICKIVRDTNTGNSKGVAFVHFARKKESIEAIAGLHDTRLPGSTQNLVVKFKEDKKEKDVTHQSKGPVQSLFGEYNEAWYGYGSTQQSEYQWQSDMQSYFVEPGEGREAGGGPMRRSMANNRYDPTSASPSLGSGMGGGPASLMAITPYGTGSGFMQNQSSLLGEAPSSMKRMTIDEAKRQPSHQLYVHGIGTEANELDLYDIFAPYGAITKVAIMKDKETKVGKGFAFVEMPDYNAALMAISGISGHPFAKNGHKPLRVDFKTKK